MDNRNYGLESPDTCPDRERMGEHACANRHQCWEPCGELGKSEAHVRVASPEASAAVDAALGISPHSRCTSVRAEALEEAAKQCDDEAATYAKHVKAAVAREDDAEADAMREARRCAQGLAGAIRALAETPHTQNNCMEKP